MVQRWLPLPVLRGHERRRAAGPGAAPARARDLLARARARGLRRLRALHAGGAGRRLRRDGGGAGERGLVENVTAAILRHLPSTERIDYFKDITGKGRTCPKTDYGTQTVTLVSLGGVFIVFFSISFIVLVAALAKGFMDKKDNNNSKAIATLQDSAMKVAGDVRMRAAFEEIARLVEAVKNIPDFAA